MKKRTRRTAIAAGLVAALAAGGAAVAGAAGGAADDDARDRPITGPALERVTAAALTATGGGDVTGTEVGDEEGAYEVEVTRADGGQVDVHLDADARVIGTEAEGGREQED